MAIDSTSMGSSSQRKRKRPLPASDSSKSTTTNSAPQRGGVCPTGASLCSSNATTSSLQGVQKRARGDESEGGQPFQEGDERKDGSGGGGGTGSGSGNGGSDEGRVIVSSHAASTATNKAPGGKVRARSQMVRQVEKLVSTMFKELDVLLRAEDINRRIMYRWSGAERTNVTLGEGKASYCTWGRELIKQYVEDAIELVRTSLRTGDWDNSVEAARRLTLQYLAKATERSIMDNEPLLHAEVMNTLGNLWFALLPYMPPPQRQHFRRLVARIRKTGGGAPRGTSTTSSILGSVTPMSNAARGAGGAGGAGAAAAAAMAKATAGALGLDGVGLYQHQQQQQMGQHLAVSFRCALEFAKLDLSPEALSAQGPQETQRKLAALLVSDVYECDAYICLWKVSEVLAGLKDFQMLCQEFRLKALDAEMWRCMLLEEQETRQKGYSDDEDDDDDFSDEEDEEEDDQQLFEEAMAVVSAPEESTSKSSSGADKDRLSVSKLATIPGISDSKKFDHLQMIHHRSTTTKSPPTGRGHGATNTLTTPTSASSPAGEDADAKDTAETTTANNNNNNNNKTNTPPSPSLQQRIPSTNASPAPTTLGALGAATAAAAAAKEAAAAVSSKFSSIRRSSALEGQESASRLGADRWRTRAALEDGEMDKYMDFMSLHQHEYRRVMTPDFLFRVWTFLQAFEPMAVAPAAAAASTTTAIAASSTTGANNSSISATNSVGSNTSATTATAATAPAVPGTPSSPSSSASSSSSSSSSGGNSNSNSNSNSNNSNNSNLNTNTTNKKETRGDLLTPARLLFVRARPFLYRVATIIPTEELNSYLDLLASKFGYQATLQLLEPLLVDEQEVFSTGRVTQALEWAIDCDQGRHLALFTRILLPRIQSRTQLERIARRAVVHGLASLPIIDRALARVPRHNYEAVAVTLSRRAVETWGIGGRGAHLVILRALQGMPSLGLYLKCRGCFLDPLASLVRPLIHQLDPCGELSIGIRLVEGIVQSAVNSIVASLEASKPQTPEGRAKAKRWTDFAFAGVRGGQFPPCLLERLFANQTFLLSVLGPPSDDASCVEAVATCFAKLAELSRTHPTAITGPVQAILATYMHHPHKHLIIKAATEKGIEVAA